MEDNGEKIPLWGMYKDDKHRTKGLLNGDKIVELDRTTSLYRFVAGIQEEVHNYSISYHRSLRDKKMTKSILDDIPGIGPKRKRVLMDRFKDIDNIKRASKEDLVAIDGITERLAEDILRYINRTR